MIKAALIGNPNCGKTTIFNALTGTQQRVGNWPGVTVEKKTGNFIDPATRNSVELTDLPGVYSLTQVNGGLDEQITRDFLTSEAVDLVINIIDAASLSRGLFLTSELQALGVPCVVAVNMIDVAAQEGIEINIKALKAQLGCPVVALIASKRNGMAELKNDLHNASVLKQFATGETVSRFKDIDRVVTDCVEHLPTALQSRTWTERIDTLALNRYAAFPFFLSVMYLMFLISINLGSAFIDFFDLVGSVLFVEGPRQLMQAIGTPAWLEIFLADGVGGGVQLVGTFIPVIGALFLVLAFLEDSGYMARVAFIVDRLLRSLGLPGKAFVPLIVGFGCNVPAVMATRALDSQPDRILTTLMAPYMSCGARLTVYALFAAAFFPKNGQNVVFALYLIGIVVAVLSALIVRKHLLPEGRSYFVMELPAYHLPTARNILLQTWQRLQGFVLRAGKAIVIVVIALNVLNSIGSDGSVGNENSENSVLSAIGKSITPAFAPMGIEPDNWPATVGIFTGIFAKEVVVGTLDALYAPTSVEETPSLSEMLSAAVRSVPENLAEISSQLGDPLGLDLGDLSDLESQAENQEVQLNTISAMQTLFNGESGAFAYLLFILLYMPCVATVGVIYKEIGAFWAVFSVSWSFVVAYSGAVIVYQAANFSAAPGLAALSLSVTIIVASAFFFALVQWGKKRSRAGLIPLKTLE
ncbi:MAG: ferrous iron transport protein B [Gammaproteobacteria bacterium]|jgi:ferrous iron transport protein B|nr:ferrous iron transport protein B [Gammaproteobacteria bacterium]